MKHSIMMIVMIIILSSCTFSENVPNMSKDANESQIDIQAEQTKEPEVYEISRVIIPESELVYKNERSGYQITFPENWRGYYVITEYSSGEVCIGFYGKSKTGQIACKHSLGRDGLDLGWIVDKKPTEGSIVIGKIGEVNGIEYFLTSPRGGTYLPDLEAISYSDSTARQLAKYNVDKTELELAAQDLKKAIPMRDDLYDMNIQFQAI